MIGKILIMPNYRRRRRPGGTFFFTVMLAPEVGTSLLRNLDKLRAAYRATHAENPFHTDAIVVLPDHLHAIWTLPKGDTDYALRWRKIKSRFTRALSVTTAPSQSEQRRGERGLWQRRFWEHQIHDRKDYDLHRAYTLWDPVRHGLVDDPPDWSASSIHRDIRLDIPLPRMPLERPVDMRFGERHQASNPIPA